MNEGSRGEAWDVEEAFLHGQLVGTAQKAWRKDGGQVVCRHQVAVALECNPGRWMDGKVDGKKGG